MTQDEVINTVNGLVQAKKGEWVVQPQDGEMIYRLLYTVNKNAYLEIPEIIIGGRK